MVESQVYNNLVRAAVTICTHIDALELDEEEKNKAMSTVILELGKVTSLDVLEINKTKLNSFLKDVERQLEFLKE